MSTPTIRPKDTPSTANFFNDKEGFFGPVMGYFARHPHKDFVIGTMTGFTEVAIDQPLVSIKNALQKHMGDVQDKSKSNPSLWKSLSVRQLYAGAGANAAGMGLITGVQMGVIGFARKKLAGERDVKDLTTAEKVGTSLLGGLAAAPIASSSELLMDAHRESVKRYEANAKKGVKPTYITTTKELWKLHNYRMFSLGLFQTAIRDMKFTFAYDVLGSYFAAQLKENVRFKAFVEKQEAVPLDVVALLFGGAFAGAIGATVSHPFDTWKTQRQSGMKTKFWPHGLRNMARKSIRLAQRTGRWDRAAIRLFRKIVAEPYKGFGPRFTRVVMAVALFNLVPWAVNEQLKKYK